MGRVDKPCSAMLLHGKGARTGHGRYAPDPTEGIMPCKEARGVSATCMSRSAACDSSSYQRVGLCRMIRDIREQGLLQTPSRLSIGEAGWHVPGDDCTISRVEEGLGGSNPSGGGGGAWTAHLHTCACGRSLSLVACSYAWLRVADPALRRRTLAW